ncbi:BgTH12-03896 [Blumeria graminis f. sp. triticale]|uniref:Bgt-51065 n=2 Tax=Blumeria graminis TaxID=34373 RepID=A0A9X9PRE7_BLUGR|nr:BgTH12-03888 [Blumeria graminis f. sp. triticale]CAD6499789.1 BgTH12-03896 [Blumeria graminis f. sp. triticale]VCU39946.1 Bgt-51065 [Blumeria graminis f. sp. tritici]
MRSFRFNLNLTMIIALIFAATADALSVHHSGLSVIGRRGMIPEHTGYQCASTKYEMYEILDAIGIACPNPKANNNFWYSYLDCSFPKTFPEALKLGFPRNTLMAPIRGSFFDSLKFHYVVFEPSTCKLRGLVRQKDKKKDGVFQLCHYQKWPSTWHDM